MPIEPYLFFEGRCNEAIAFYQKALGAEVTALMRYGESPEPEDRRHGTADKVMHASLRIGDTAVMVSDGFCKGKPEFQGFGLFLTLPNEAQVRRAFSALAEGGTIRMPLEKTFYSALFGMVADRFGILWMLGVAP